MTLRRRLLTQIILMVAGIALAGAVAAWGLVGLHQDFGIALQANEQLRDVYEVGMQVGAARLALEADPPSPLRAREALRRAAAMFATRRAGGRWLEATEAEADAAAEALRASVERFAAPPGEPPAGFDAAAVTVGPYAALADFSAATRQAIMARQTAADRRHRMTLAAVIGLAAALVVFAAWVGRRQYRAVMRPLSRLQALTRRMADGELDQRLEATGDAEFAAVSRDFNRMADQLREVYRDLERRVEIKSRELARSERLASVGYLAAGVAHEINNPLGIIAGYGERALQRLERGDGGSADSFVRKALGVICEEAFRCKTITDHLLMLARPAESKREPVALAAVVASVAAGVAAMPRFAGRAVELDAEPGANTTAPVNEGQLRQVVLNLLVNALEATDAEAGRVRIELRRRGNEVELAVIDNGRGMTPETRERVFEPFFTDKRGERPGTGLGLSVVHAIVREHGGRIEAHSDGPGQGSRFTVTLPAT